MLIYIILTLLILLVFLLNFLDNIKRKQQNYPPGPYRLPVVGNLLFMLPAMVPAIKDSANFFSYFGFNEDLTEKYLQSKPAYIIFDEISRIYGNLVSLQLGINSGVIVSSSNYAKDVFCREEFANRFADDWFLERQFNTQLGLIFNNGKDYRALKFFTTKHLKHFGLGRKESMEIAVQDELRDFLHEFKAKLELNKGVVSIHHLFTVPILNILWKMVAGIRFSYDDKKLQRLIKITEEISKSHDLGGNILMAFPGLRFIAPELTGHNRQMQLYNELKQFFGDLLEKRTLSLDACAPRDYVDVFLNEMRKRKENPSSSTGGWLTEEQFVITSLDLFTAGSETTSNTLEWALLYTMLNPRVQKKVQAEIDDVIGESRLPDFADRSRMPYTAATLLEVQRMCNVIPLVHRVATKDTTLGPYNIKKDDVLICNLHTIHNDRQVWGDPNVFRPERFLSDGNLIKTDSVLSFGMGKRVCMGEMLAKHTLFTYFTSLLQIYNFQMNQEKEIPNTKPSFGYTISPQPFFAFVTHRKSW